MYLTVKKDRHLYPFAISGYLLIIIRTSLVGVYFTSLGPRTSTSTLIQNNFANSGNYVRNPSVFYHRIKHVVEITFNEDDVEKIQDGSRDLYVYRGDVDLTRFSRYEYSIYKNPNPP